MCAVIGFSFKVKSMAQELCAIGSFSNGAQWRNMLFTFPRKTRADDALGAGRAETGSTETNQGLAHAGQRRERDAAGKVGKSLHG
jgi:hypothetical protein